MNPHSGGGSWPMIPSVQSHSNVSTPTKQDHLYLSPSPASQQQQLHPQQFQQQQQVQQSQRHQSLASHLHLSHLVENLGDAIYNGSRDQHSDALICHFEKCQQLLNSIAASVNTKAMTVEGQKRKLEGSEQLLTQRQNLISHYGSSVEDLVKTEP